MTRHDNDLIVEAVMRLAKRALAQDNNEDSGISRLEMVELVRRLERLNERRVLAESPRY
jgi:hypothetical protein